MDVTGSITFVADDESFSNMLWDLEQAQTQGIRESCDTVNSCWLDVIPEGQWVGNSAYFQSLIFDMMVIETQNYHPALETTSLNIRSSLMKVDTQLDGFLLLSLSRWGLWFSSHRIHF